MSFAPSTETKTAENNLAGTSNLALNNFYPATVGAGANQLSTGGQNVASGTNFLQTVLGGNAANTAAALQPNIGQITNAAQNNMNAINTLTPRGGGRSSALFAQSFAPQAQVSNLFNQARTNAATTLPQIGLQQEGLGTNLFSAGGNALNTAAGANNSLATTALNQTKLNEQLFSGLGGGLMSLFLSPFVQGSRSGNNIPVTNGEI